MSDLNTTFVDLPSEMTPVDAAYLNLVSKRIRGTLPIIDVVEDHGAKVDGVTDDTAAWQAAITAAGAAGGARIISSKMGVSVIAGALTDVAGANSQLKLPTLHAPDAENISIVIEGALPPPNDASVIGATPLPDNHLVIKSTLAAGTGALLGAYGTGSSVFTNVTLTLKNVTFRMPANPTNSALDLRRVACVDLDHVIVDAGSYNVDGIAAQTTATSFGLRLPANNNGAHTRLGQVDVIGFYNGFEYAEHSYGEYVAAWGCKVGHTFVATNHASKFQRLATYHCQKGIVFTGTHYVDVDQFNIEHAASGTWVTTADIDDPSNYGHGWVWWHVVLESTGIDSTFTKNGGTGLQVNRMGTALGGGGGATVYWGRDRLVAAAGDELLTLGASPVANSPLVWVNNVIKWPTTDYAIADDEITFTTPLAASDVVLVAYQSTSAPGASTLAAAAPTVVLADNFNRSASGSMGSTSTGSVAWQEIRGDWGISDNAAFVGVAGAGSFSLAVVESGVADCIVSMKVGISTGTNQPGMFVRATDSNNGYVIESGNGSTKANIFKVVSGAFTSIGSSAGNVQFVTGDTIEVFLSGTSITVKRNGSVIITATDSTYTTQTKHGFYLYGAASNVRFDDFSVSA